MIEKEKQTADKKKKAPHLSIFYRLSLTILLLTLAGFFVHYVTKDSTLVWEPASAKGEQSQESSTSSTVSIGGPFRLVDSQGIIRTDREFRGRYLLVYFGYTFCPDICPMALSNISQALPLLGRDRDQVVPIFITIDPERDTQSALRDYSSHFHPNIFMLTGTPASVMSAMKAYRVYGAKVVDDKATDAQAANANDDYLMDHSTLIHLMDRQGRFLRCFPHTTPGSVIADGILAVLADEHKSG
jgi:protein SCO1/2